MTSLSTSNERQLEPVAFSKLPAEEALPELVQRHGSRLFRLGVRICGSHAEAEDLVQEVFLQAYRKWHQFEGQSDPHTWLYTIAMRVCQRFHRPRAGEPTRIQSLTELLPASADGIPDVPAVDPNDPYRETLRHELEEALDVAIRKLPMKFRIPVILKEILELSIEDTASILAVKPNTVKTRLHRARLALRKSLSAKLPRKVADPDQLHSEDLCFDLLAAKQKALDNGVPMLLPDDTFCIRCQSLFRTLDLTQDVCRRIREGEIPEEVRDRLVEALERADSGESNDAHSPFLKEEKT